MSSKPGPHPPAPDEDLIVTPLAAAAPPQLGPTPWISFSGASNESGTSFAQSVQRIAFMQNRVKDDEWIAEYASTCFADSALVWYLGLDQDTRSSWEKLRLALVQRYPFQSPNPAAASVGRAQPGATSSATTDVGRIEVLRSEFGDVLGYLSQDSVGKCVVNPSPKRALTAQAVLHTDSQQQAQKIYSLRVINAADPQFPFLGLRLVKFPEEDPDVIPRTMFLSWYNGQDIPSCCKCTKEGLALKTRNSGWGAPGEKRTEFATWDFVQTTESSPGPYYLRKAEGRAPKARVVSAVWTMFSPPRGTTELGLVWPSGNSLRGGAATISETLIAPVLHKGDNTGLHAHAYDFPKNSTTQYYLDERLVVLLFKPIPSP